MLTRLSVAVAGRCHAGVLVSPAVVEAHAVQVGDEIVISCTEMAGREQLITLSLGLFDQDEHGRVVFYEDQPSRMRAAEIISLSHEQFYLQPHERRGITLRVNPADFLSSYVVVFVRPEQVGISSRLAVLLMLSTAVARRRWTRQMCASVAVLYPLTFTTQAACTGQPRVSWPHDSAGELQGEFVVQSGRILPNRQRQTDLLLPIEPHTVRFVPLPDAGSSFQRQRRCCEAACGCYGSNLLDRGGRRLFRRGFWSHWRSPRTAYGSPALQFLACRR